MSTSDSYRVYRGGSWNLPPALVRVAHRGRGAPSRRYAALGFRLCRRLDVLELLAKALEEEK